MPAGRPTKYNADMLAKAWEYLQIHEALGDVVPTREGMADYLDIAQSTLYKWAGEHPEFSEPLERANNKQAKMLISGGLANRFQPTIVKLMLANHGYHERLNLEHSGEIHAHFDAAEKDV